MNGIKAIMIILIILINYTQPQMTIFPDNYLTRDEYYKDDITNPTEVDKYIAFAYLQGSSTLGYKDEYSGVFYTSKKLCYDPRYINNINIYYSSYYATTLDATMIANLADTNLQGLFNGGTNYNQFGMWCLFNFFVDNSDTIFYMKIQMIYTIANPTSVDCSIGFQSTDQTTTHPITTITLNSNENKDLIIKFTVLNGIISYALSTESYATVYTTTTGSKTYFDNSNYSLQNLILVFDNTPNTLTLMRITSFLLLSHVPSGVRSLSGSINNDCSFNRGCVDGTYCHPIMLACKLCDPQCKSCFSDSDNACSKCFPTSSDYFTTFTTATQCKFDFVDLSKYNDFSLNVPAPYNYRVTFNFWMFVHDTKSLTDAIQANSAISLILKDFLALSFMQGTSDTSLDLYCIPLQLINPISSIIKLKSSFLSSYLKSNIQHTKKTVTTASSKWMFIKCAFSYDHKEMYINDETPVALNFPNYYNNYTFKTFIKKFYRQSEGSDLIFQGFYFLQTEVYIRNFNVFSEYLPQDMNLKYHNLHTLTSMQFFPQLLFSLPFDDLIQDGSTNIAKTTLYDYSNHDGTILKKSDIEITFVGDSLKPPKNFKRIKFLALNTKYSSVNLSTTSTLTCASPRAYCYDDNKAYACISNNNLNTLTFACSSSCPSGKTRLPQLKNAFTFSMCNYNCPTGTSTCPITNTQLLNLKTIFACSATYYKTFYKCYSKSSFNNESSIQFSGTLKTRSIKIDLTATKTNFIIDMWIHPDLLFQQIPPIVNSHILLTENHQIYYDITIGKFIFLVKDATGSIKTLTIDDNLYYYGWNHIVLSNIQIETNTKTKIQISFSNNFFKSSSLVATLDGSIPTRYICYCNIDTGTNCCDVTSSLTWMDVWIKSLKIWDGNFTTIWTALEYEKFKTKSPAFLLNYFSFAIDRINGDEIPDTLNSGTIKAVVPFNSNALNLNPDYDNSFNFGWDLDFSYNDNNPGKFAFSMSKSSSNANVQLFYNCDVSCSVCYGISNYQCLSCNSGYALVGNTCRSSGLNNSGTGYYYFINPTETPPTKLSLNISSLNLDDYPSLTIFFFIKIFGFKTSAANTKMILLDSSKNFDLFYNSVTKGITLQYNNIIEYTYPDFQEKYFGTWVPISIAMFRSPNISLQAHMSQMTIYDKLMPKLSNINQKFTLTEISFPSGFIGMIAEITLYSTFIINAWGISQHPNSATLLAGSPIIYKFSMKSATAGQDCISSADLSPQTAAGVGLSCVPDYIPQLDQSCRDDQLVDLDLESYNTSRCLSNTCMCTDQCIAEMSKCDWTLSTCNNKTSQFVNYLLYQYIDLELNNYIVCGDHNGLDLARYKKGLIPNMTSPMSTFKMEFWFFTRSYIGNQFGSLEVIWDKHVKIVISRDGLTISSKCFAIPDVSTPANDGVAISVSLGTQTAMWYYIVCGVDHTKNKFYISSGRTSTLQEQTYPNDKTIDATSSLTIEEKSPVNYGVTYFRELRLWSCYNCNSQMAYVNYYKDNLRFQNVLHYFDFLDPAGEIADMQTGIKSLLRITQLQSKDGFFGYNILPEAIPPPNCVEDNFNYFNMNTNLGCDKMFNMNILDNVIFKDIPISRSNRYTLEFWIYVEGPNDFTKGINIIFENHISISILAESTTSTGLSAYCLPQAYRDKIKDSYGEDVIRTFDNALNKQKDFLSGMFSNWVFLKCAFDLDREIFYFNNIPQKSLLKENFYYDNLSNSIINNISPFKFFIPNNKYTNLIVQGALLNKTRIFMRTLNIYREFIPASIDLRYREMKNFVNLNYWPIILSVDFIDYDPTYRGLLYYYNDYDDGKATSSYIYTYLQNISSKDYGTYPVYETLTFCNEKQKLFNGACVDIASSVSCDKTSTFCLDDNKYFWCKSGLYLNPINLSCTANCPSTTTRLPETPDNLGMCLFNCDSNLYSVCPSSGPKMIKSEYTKLENFNCREGYTRTNFKCYINSIINSSALYFSNSFNLLNTLANFSSKTITEYYVEVWIMIDNFFPLSYSESTYTYLVAHPHKIILNSLDKKFYYTNAFLKTGKTLYELNSFNKYEWNRIIIKNYKDKTLINDVLVEEWYIDVYMNNNFSRPEVRVTMNKGFDMNLAGFAFCNQIDQCKLGTITNSIQVEANWGSAFYRNFRVWNHFSSNIFSIIQNDNPNAIVLGDLTDNLLAFYKFTIDSIKMNKIISYVNSPDFDMNISYIFSNQLDEDIRVNYAANFDIPERYNSTFVSSILPNINATYVSNQNNYNLAANFTLSNCSPECLRCYSNKLNDCYQCNDAKILIGRKCYSPTNYYFKLPLNDNIINKVSLTNKNKDEILLKDTNPITMTFYMKFLGVNLKSSTYSSTKINFPILNFYDDSNFIGWNNDIKQFQVIYDTVKTIFSYEKSNEYIGRWTHFGISIYKSSNSSFPNMINFMIDKNIIPHNQNYDLQNTIINMNIISLSNSIVAYFSKLRIYNSFYLGTFGLEQAQSVKSSLSDLLLEFPLQSKNSNLTCLNKDEILGGNLIEGMNCILDYNENEDESIQCDSTKSTKSVNILAKSTGSTTIDCINCNKTYCNSFCYGEDFKQCTCKMNSENYSIRNEFIENKDKTISQMFYCDKLDSLNVAYYQPITISNIKVGSNEYKIEMWIYISSYNKLVNNFPGMNIIWNHHTRIEIIQDGLTNLKVKCYPYSNISDLSSYTFSLQDKAQMRIWSFITCSVNILLNQMSINSSIKQDIKQTLPKFSVSTTSLVITDNSINSYGIALLRELRLWSGSNYLFYDTSRINLDSSFYSSLLHYYKNNFTPESLNVNILHDIKNEVKSTLTKTKDYITGYNYIVNYTKLTLCEEGEVYKNETDSCEAYTLEDFYFNLSKNSTYTSEELLSRSQLVYKLAIDIYSDGLYQNKSMIFPDQNVKTNLTLVDPPCNSKICNSRGYCKIIDKYATCYCLGGYLGINCHIKTDNFTNLENIYNLFWNKTLTTLSTYGVDLNILNSMSYVIRGSSKFMTDSLFLDKVINKLSNLITIPTQLIEKVFSDEELKNVYMNLINNIYTSNLIRMNILKGKTMIQLYPNGFSPRDVPLNYVQKADISQTFINSRKLIESFVMYMIKNSTISNNYYNFYSDNFDIDLFQVDQNFNFLNFYNKKLTNSTNSINNYRPYFDMKKCLDSINQGINYKYWIYFTSWFNSPYIYEENLYMNYTSTLVSVRVYSLSGEEIKIEKCEDENQINLFLTMSNPELVNIVNVKRELMLKGNIYAPNDPIFTQPFYIEPSGIIQNTTRQERIDKFYMPIKLNFNFFDQSNQSFNKEGMTFHNYSETNYLICNSSHLTDFMMTYTNNQNVGPEDSRLYYLNFPQIFTNLSNYIINYGLFISLTNLVIYLSLMLMMSLIERSRVKQNGLKKTIEDELMKYIYPYGNLEEEIHIKEKLNNKKNEIDSYLTSRNIEEINRLKPNDRNNIIIETPGDISNENEINNNLQNTDKINKNNKNKSKRNNKNNKSAINKDNIYIETNEDDNVENIDDFDDVNNNDFDINPDVERSRNLQFNPPKPNNEIDAYSNKDILVLKQNYVKNNTLRKSKTVDDKFGKLNEESLKNVGDIDEDIENDFNYDEKGIGKKNNNYLDNFDRKFSKEEDLEKQNKNKIEFREYTVNKKVLNQRIEVYNSNIRQKDLIAMNLNCCVFMFRNIRNRNILLTTILDVSQLYPASLRILYLFIYFTLILLFTSIIYLFIPELIFPDILSNPIFFIIYSLAVAIVTNCILCLISIIFHVNSGKIRILIHKMKFELGKFELEW